ncbi:MAG: hypothetical protein ACYDHH_31060 [Solirubrobacteraceae bacterium]
MARRDDLRREPLGERQVRGGLAVAQPPQFTGLAEPVEPVLADGLEQREPCDVMLFFGND